MDTQWILPPVNQLEWSTWRALCISFENRSWTYQRQSEEMGTIWHGMKLRTKHITQCLISPNSWTQEGHLQCKIRSPILEWNNIQYYNAVTSNDAIFYSFIFIYMYLCLTWEKKRWVIFQFSLYVIVFLRPIYYTCLNHPVRRRRSSNYFVIGIFTRFRSALVPHPDYPVSRF